MITCSETLTQLLSAEPGELTGSGDSELAVHIAQCGRCRAVASQLLADTSVMAAIVNTPAASAISRGTARGWRLGSLARLPLSIGGLGLAATAIGWLYLFSPRVTPSGATATIAVAVPAPPPNRDTVPSTFSRKAPAASVHRLIAMSPEVVAIPPTRFADAAAATPSRFVASQTVSEPLQVDPVGVSVYPPTGVRSAVLATRNPAITIVWLY